MLDRLSLLYSDTLNTYGLFCISLFFLYDFFVLETYFLFDKKSERIFDGLILHLLIYSI